MSEEAGAKQEAGERRVLAKGWLVMGDNERASAVVVVDTTNSLGGGWPISLECGPEEAWRERGVTNEKGRERNEADGFRAVYVEIVELAAPSPESEVSETR